MVVIELEVATTIVAAMALLVSIVVYALTQRVEEKRERRARMPVLVVFPEEETILIRNIGTGPALNIVFAEGETANARVSIRLESGVHEVWFNPVHLPPIPSRGETVLTWKLGRFSKGGFRGVGLIYTDAFGAQYTVKMSAMGTVLLEGRHLPVWPMNGVPYPGALANMTERWLTRPESLG